MSAREGSPNARNVMPTGHPLNIRVGSDVFVRDGQAGKVERLVFSPRQQKITHLIVERGFLLRKDVVVPIEHVLRAGADRVDLDITSNELNDLPGFHDTNFIASHLLEKFHVPFDASKVLLRLDRSAASDALDRRVEAGHPPRRDAPELPDDAVIIRRGMPVEDHDGRLGVVEDVMLDRHRRIVTHFIARPASMLTPGIVVPIDWVRGIDHKTIFVDADRDQVEQLPKIALTSDDEDLGDKSNSSSREDEHAQPSSSGEDSLLSSRYAESGVDYLWVEQFLYNTSGLRFDAVQVEELVEHAERKLRDLLDSAKDVAIANGRETIYMHDIPISPGLRSLMRDTLMASDSVTPNKLEAYLSSVGMMSRFDDEVRQKLPHLLGTLLVLAGRITATLTPRGMEVSERIAWLSMDEESEWPLHGEVERARRIIDLAI